MSLNSTPLNSIPINGAIAPDPIPISGTLVEVAQNVRVLTSGTLVAVEQEVQLRETLSGTLVTIEQEIKGSLSGTLITVAQAVRTIVQGGRNYDAQVIIGGVEIPKDQYIRDLTVSFNEDAGAIADVSLAPPSGIQDIGFYYGKEIIINASVNDGGLQRIYTGVIDTCQFDIIDSITTLKCTNRRQELLNAVPASAIGPTTDISIISGEYDNNYELVEERMTYVPFSLEFDAYNQWHYVAWEPKASPDYVLGGSDVFRRDPSIEVVNRGRVINKVNIAFSYTSSRLHNASLTMRVDADQDNWSNTLATGKTLLGRSTVTAVSEGGVWKRGGPITFEPLPPPGWYGGRAWIGDATIDNVQDAGITSSSGRVRTSTPIATYNSTRANCLSATWQVYSRWVQDIQSNYTLTVQSTTSQATFGVVEQNESYSFTDGYNTDAYLDDPRYRGAFTTSTGLVIDLGITGFSDVQQDVGRVHSNIQSAILKAQTDILRTHRENTITCQVELMPEIQLYHTVEINAPQLQVTGKVTAYNHVIRNSVDDTYTDLEIKCYLLGVGGSDSALSVPAISTPNYSSYPTTPASGAFYGIEPAANPDNVRPGWYGNKYKSGVYTTVTPQLIVDYPSISSSITNGAEYTASSTYTVEIPNNIIVVDYDEI